MLLQIFFHPIVAQSRGLKGRMGHNSSLANIIFTFNCAYKKKISLLRGEDVVKIKFNCWHGYTIYRFELQWFQGFQHWCF